MTTAQISKRLDSILKFMEPYWSWVNCHMVNFITDKHWLTFVPHGIQRELTNAQDIQKCIELVFWGQDLNSQNKFPECLKFIADSQQHCVQQFEDIVMPKQSFENNILRISKDLQTEQISIKEFLSEKKRHEVEITAKLINDLIKATFKENEETVIVDAGDGKGYLSSRLALEYGHKVLGIDSNSSNTENALERNKKLKRAWNALKERAELESKGITPPRRGRQKQNRNNDQAKPILDNENYKTLEKFITTDLELPELINEAFPEAKNSPPSVCLTGLHTCGNLASTCLQLFHNQNQCQLLCNIGCCYHLLREKYSGQEFFGNKHILDLNQEFGFPLSNYLQSMQVRLGRNARMLAVQSVERTKSTKMLPNISLFYRALLEVLVCELNPNLKDTIQVGKVKKFNNFEEYVAICMQKYPDLEIPKERIETVQEEYSQYKDILDVFYLLRMSFAPVVESLILLDRLLFLKECGYDKSYIIPAFDAIISPRRFAIVAIKK